MFLLKDKYCGLIPNTLYGSFWGRLCFLRKTWSAQVRRVKSAPAASCKQQSVRSVHVKVCLIVPAGTGRARLGTFWWVKYKQSEPSWLQASTPNSGPCLDKLDKGTFCTTEQGRHDNAWHDWHQLKDNEILLNFGINLDTFSTKRVHPSNHPSGNVKMKTFQACCSGKA